MRSGSPRRFLGRNVAGTILSDVRAWATGLTCLLCVAIPAGVVPDPAWSQFSSGGYSRPGGGFKSYPAPVRRPPAASSGGYYRRVLNRLAGRPGNVPGQVVRGGTELPAIATAAGHLCPANPRGQRRPQLGADPDAVAAGRGWREGRRPGRAPVPPRHGYRHPHRPRAVGGAQMRSRSRGTRSTFTPIATIQCIRNGAARPRSGRRTTLRWPPS